MTEQALKDAKLQTLESENHQMQQALRSFSGTMKAQKQTIDELMQANITLRGSLFLQEEELARFTKEYAQISERCIDLERKIEDLTKLREVA